MEVVLAAAIMAIVMPAIIMLLNHTNKGFAGFEAFNSLKTMNENTVNRMYLRLGRCKRLFQNDTMGTAMLSNMMMTGAPAKMIGSRLPVVLQNGSLTPGTTSFDGTAFGNSMLLAYNSETRVMDNISDSASTPSTCTVRVDLYKFAYYYLTPSGSPSIGGKQTYKNTEWESISYADCGQLTTISNSQKRSKSIVALYDGGVRYCWNSSASAYNVSFSSLVVTGTGSAAAGSVFSAPGHKAQKNSVKTLTSLVMGIMGGAYQYGVSANTAGMTGNTRTVPAFATTSGTFPAGFEVGVIGPTAGRKVLVRSVIYASGPMNRPIMDEKLIIAVARDIW